MGLAQRWISCMLIMIVGKLWIVRLIPRLVDMINVILNRKWIRICVHKSDKDLSGQDLVENLEDDFRPDHAVDPEGDEQGFHEGHQVRVPANHRRRRRRQGGGGGEGGMEEGLSLIHI